MKSLIEKIKYQRKSYSELTDPGERLEIELLASKLAPIEDEIVSDEKGTITIMKSGNVFSDSFKPEVAAKITKIITGN